MASKKVSLLRFGLVCSLEHANEIFERHNLPKDGCNM